MVKVALIQLRTPASQDAALRHAEPLIREAAAKGATVLFTPEGSNLLVRDRRRLFATLATPETDVAVLGYRALAAELGVWIALGSAMVRRADGQAANRSLLIDPAGAVRASYDKIHMFDVDLPGGERYRESDVYTPGERAVVAEVPTPSGPVSLGLTICYDLRFPALHAALARAGAEILAVPAAFTRPTGAAHWEILLRARAIETGSFVLAAAQGGRHEGGHETWGHSMAVAPWGEVLALADHDEPCVITADLDLAQVARARSAIPALVNARAFLPPEAPVAAQAAVSASQRAPSMARP